MGHAVAAADADEETSRRTAEQHWLCTYFRQEQTRTTRTTNPAGPTLPHELSPSSLNSKDSSPDQEVSKKWSGNTSLVKAKRAAPPREEPGPRRYTDNGMTLSARLTDAVERDSEQGKCRAKVIVAVVVLGLLAATITDLACHDNVRNFLSDTFDWIEENPESGVVVFALIFGLATLLFVPGIILTVGAGVAFGRAMGFGWGLLWGTVSVLMGALFACVAAFYLGRYVMHEQAQSCANRYRILGAVNKAIETNGIKVMILLRLSPLVPFSGFNFIAGLTKVSIRDYLIGTVGVFPGTFAFVFIGASTAGTMNEEDRMNEEGADRTTCIIRMVVLIVGCVAAVVAIIAVTIYARRALKEALMESELEAKARESQSRPDVERGNSGSTVGEELKEEFCARSAPLSTEGSGSGSDTDR